MLGNARGKRLYDYMSDYVVFDLETTGTSCNSDEVIEISAIKVKDGEVVDEFTSLVNPERPIPFYASQVNGITDDMVIDAPTFDIVLREFLEFTGDAVLVGHNIHSFDMKFIYRDAERYYCQTAHCGRRKPYFDFGVITSPIVPYRNSPQTPSGMTADCRSLIWKAAVAAFEIRP